ncbi:MAG: ParB/RepB/Spo0J family partition protein [Proteobacteria bacterium]|nr:ParB/RepB/Spo0J family partition protein [Pseudomonadota bacterium]
MTESLKQNNNTSSKPTTRRALGRGLAALLPDADYIETPSVYTVGSINVDTHESPNQFFMCPVDKLFPCSRQPRQNFKDEEIKGLAVSIKENGLIQPLIVRKRGNNYEIVAGERRWRAAKLAGLESVPVIFKNMSDKATLQTALVENIQRSDLNSIEEARAYKQLLEEFSMTHEDISKNVGKDRSSITNYLRLLKLPDSVQAEIILGSITMGHAKILCSIDSEKDLLRIAKEITSKNLSVRDLENLVNKAKNAKNHNNIKSVEGREGVFNSIEDNLREKFKTKVHIDGRYEKGKFVIEYFNKDDFERILSILFE